MDAALFLYGAVIGLIMTAPVGPVNLLVIRHAVRNGFTLAFLCGLASALADALYASVAAYGVSSVAHLLTTYERPLMAAGGVVLVVMGVRIARTRTELQNAAAGAPPVAGDIARKMFTAFMLTLTNPGVLFGFLAWLAFAGLDYLPGALYVVIIYTYPAMVAVGSRLLGKPTSRRVWSAVFLTLVGIGFTVPEVVNGAGESALLGMFLTLGNAFLYACYILYSERIVSDTSGDENAGDGYVATAWGLAGSLAVSAVIVVVAGGFEAPAGAKSVWSMIGLAVISTVVAIVAFFVGVRHLGPAPAALVASTEPVLTLVWVVAFLGESLVPIQIVGAILVIAGVVWSQWTPRSANVI